jgi:Invasion associated locus B (IalB) protein
MTRFRLHRLGLLVLLTFSLALPGRAAETDNKHASPKHAATGSTAVHRLGGAGPWNAYLYKEKSGRVCYLAGGPQKSVPPRFKRKLPAVMVTHRPEENVANVVSFDEGYPLKEGSDASLDIDGTHFALFTKGNTAWSRTSDLDRTIVEAMAKGRQAVLKAMPQKGPPTSDTYSLSGFAETLGLIDKACGIKR